jgi:hypothetical protein
MLHHTYLGAAALLAAMRQAATAAALVPCCLAADVAQHQRRVGRQAGIAMLPAPDGCPPPGVQHACGCGACPATCVGDPPLAPPAALGSTGCVDPCARRDDVTAQAPRIVTTPPKPPPPLKPPCFSHIAVLLSHLATAPAAPPDTNLRRSGQCCAPAALRRRAPPAMAQQLDVLSMPSMEVGRGGCRRPGAPTVTPPAGRGRRAQCVRPPTTRRGLIPSCWTGCCGPTRGSRASCPRFSWTTPPIRMRRCRG